MKDGVDMKLQESNRMIQIRRIYKNLKDHFGLTAFQLKVIAAIFMTIDHIAAIAFKAPIVYNYRPACFANVNRECVFYFFRLLIRLRSFEIAFDVCHFSNK